MNRENILIFGNTKFAEMIGYYIKTETNDNLIGFTVDKKYFGNKAVMEGTIFPFEEIDTIFSKDEVKILPVIGYKQMNNIRKELLNRVKEKGYRITSFVHPTAKIAANCSLGEGNIFLEDALVQPFVSIGSGNVFWSKVNISHHTKIGDFNYFAPSASVSGNVTIGSNCFLGNNCTVKNDISIHNYTLIGAGAYVSQNTKEYSVIVPVRSQILENKSSMDINLI